MSKTVVLPNALEISFPDNATDAEMSASLAQYLLTGAPAQQVEAEEAVEVERPEATGKFFKSIGRGIDQMQGAIGSGIDVIGEASGWEGLEKFGERQAARNEVQLLEKEAVDPRLQLRDVENIMVGKQSWVDYIQQSLGEVLPSMGISLAGAGAGAKAGAAMGNVLTGPLVPAKLLGVPLGALIGGAIGAFLPSALMGTGEVQQTIKELDPDAESPWAALGGGAIIGALDVAALSVPVLKSIGKGIPKDSILKGLINNGVSEKVAKGAVGTAYKSISNVVKNKFPAGRVGKALSLGVQSAGAEGLTERLQELTSIEIAEAVTDKEVMNRAERLLEATVMGVIAGAGLGGGAGAITGKNYDPSATPLPEIERGADDEIILSSPDPIAMMAEETLVEQEEVNPLKLNTDINKIATDIWENDLAYDPDKDAAVFTYNGKTYEVKEVKLKNKQRVIEVSVDGTVIPELRSKPYKKPIKYFGAEVKKQIRNVIKQEGKAPVEPEQIKWNTPSIMGLDDKNPIYPRSDGDFNDPYIFEQDKLDKTLNDRIRTDQKRLNTAIKKVPALFMDTLIYGDPNFSTINKPQTIKSFGDKFSVKSIEERVAIFDALIENGRIELVGKNKWKYTDSSLNNKQYKAIANKAKKNSVIYNEPQRTGNKTIIPAEINGKKVTITEEIKNTIVQKDLFGNGRKEKLVRYDVRGEGNKGGKKLIYKDREFRRFKAGESREAELNSFTPQIFAFMNQEHIGIFAEQNLRTDKRYPVGTSVEESFQILLLGKGLKNKNDKPYKNYKDLIDDIALREKDVENLIQDKALKQKEAKERRRLRNPGIDRLIEAEIADIDNNIASAKQEIVDRKLVIKGFDSTNTIAQPATLKEIERTLTARERQSRRERSIKENAKIAFGINGADFKPFTNENRGERGANNVLSEGKNIPEDIKTSSDRVSFWTNWVNSGTQIANVFKDYLPFHNIAKKYDQTFRNITAVATQQAGSYAQLNTRANKDKRINVHRFLYAGMLADSKGEYVDGNKTLIIPKYFSWEGYGIVRADGIVQDVKGKIIPEGTIIEDDTIIEKVINNYRENNPDGPLYTKEYFQEAVDKAVGGKRRNAKMYKFKAGEPVTLTDPLESAAVESLHLALNTIYQRMIEGIVNQAGSLELSGSRVFSGEGQWWDYLEAQVDKRPPNVAGEPITSVSELLMTQAEKMPKIAKGKNTGKLTPIAAYYEDIANAVVSLEGMKRDGYFPSVREGDGNVKIMRYVRNKKTGKLEKKTAYREDIIESFTDRVAFSGNFQRTGKKHIAKHYPNWREDHPEAKKDAGGNYIPEEGKHAIEYQRNNDVVEEDFTVDINMPGLERIFLTYDQVYNTKDENGKSKETDPNKFDGDANEFQRRLANIFKHANQNKKNRSFKAHQNRRRGIPGFVNPENMDTYWSQGFGLYTAKAGRFIARLETENPMREELKKLKALRESKADTEKPLFGSTLFHIAKAQAEFLYSPQSAASFFKTIAFNGFLGGNISSLMVNLSQLSVAASFLYGAYGIKGRGAILVASKDAAIIAKDIMFAPAQFIFFPLPEAGTPESEWTAAEKAGEAKYKKWRKNGAIESREMYNLLVESQRKGSFGKINTEAIAQNSDVTLNFIQKKVGITQWIANPIGSVSSFLTTMYASGEMINRITTTLATTRLVKKFGSGELRNFAEGVPGQNILLGTEHGSFEELVAAGETASNATQFNLDPYNRPRYSRYFGGVPMQFLGFVTLMIEVYSNALFGNYGKKELNFINDTQKRRMLVALVGQQLMLGGIFAFPFVDDLDDIVKLISDKIPEMPTTNIYEILYETMVDDAGLDADTATAILRGPLEGYGPISIGKRIALSPFQNILNMRSDNILQVPFKLIGGPSASFIEGWSSRIGSAAKEGRWDKVAAYLPPTALTTNIANAYYNSMEGMRTGSGRQLNDGLSGLDSMWALIGFTPTTVSRDRDEIARVKYMNSRMSSVRDKYVDKITALQLASRREDDPIKKQAYMDRISKLINEVYKRDAGKEMEDKIDPSYSIIPSVGTRMKQALDPVTPGAIAQPRKIMLPRMLELMGRDRP